MILFTATNCLSETWPPQKEDIYKYSTGKSCPSIASAQGINKLLIFMSSNKTILQSSYKCAQGILPQIFPWSWQSCSYINIGPLVYLVKFQRLINNWNKVIFWTSVFTREVGWLRPHWNSLCLIKTSHQPSAVPWSHLAAPTYDHEIST